MGIRRQEIRLQGTGTARWIGPDNYRSGRIQKGINSILGNALEWLDDCWHGGYRNAPNDGSSWNTGLECDKRVVRGSSWEGEYTLTEQNVSYFRPYGIDKTTTRPTLGFRLAGDRR